MVVLKRNKDGRHLSGSGGSDQRKRKIERDYFKQNLRSYLHFKML